METGEEKIESLAVEKILELAISATRDSFKEIGFIKHMAFLHTKRFGIVGMSIGSEETENLAMMFTQACFSMQDLISLVIQVPGTGAKISWDEMLSDRSVPINPQTRPDKIDCISVIAYDGIGRKLSQLFQVLPTAHSPQEILSPLVSPTDQFRCTFDNCFSRPSVNENLN